jgi:hypothetical protein
MFGLLSRWTQKPRPSHARRARLRLERLEARDNPSTLTLSVTYGSGRSVTLSGTLSNTANPAMQQIDFSGQVSGFTGTNSQGQFSATFQAAALGTITATDHDGSSNSPQVTLADVTPTLTFIASEGQYHQYTLYGDVTYVGHDPSSLTVTFGGDPESLQMVSTWTDTNGHYSTTVTLNGTSTDNGVAWAKVTTPWGTDSALKEADIHQTGT